jgi:hypothetical protein
MPAVVRIVWPAAATITTPAHYREVASAAMRLLAEVSTTLVKRLPNFLRRLRPGGRPMGFSAATPAEFQKHVEPLTFLEAAAYASSRSHRRLG